MITNVLPPFLWFTVYMVCGLLLAAFTGSWFGKCVDLYPDLLGSDLAHTVYDKTAQSDIEIWSDPLTM